MAGLILTVSVWVSVDIYVEMLRDSPHLVGPGSLSPPLWPGLTSLGREISGEAGRDNTDFNNCSEENIIFSTYRYTIAVMVRNRLNSFPA